LTIMLETGDIKWFDKAGNYASYCRCISGARYSNGKKKGKTNSKNGNKYLAWAFTEAAGFAIRYNKTVKAYYQRKMAKTNQPSKQWLTSWPERAFTCYETKCHLR